jgi:hypothetical protein
LRNSPSSWSLPVDGIDSECVDFVASEKHQSLAGDKTTKTSHKNRLNELSRRRMRTIVDEGVLLVFRIAKKLLTRFA